MVATPSKHDTKPRHGEDVLPNVRDVSIKLDSGERVRFNLAAEVGVPRNPLVMIREARRAPARVLFWSAQLARADAEVRKHRRRVSQMEGTVAQKARAYYHKGSDERFVTDRMVNAVVDTVSEVRDVRVSLDTAEVQRDMIRAVYDAVVHRCYVLRKLVGLKVDEDRL